MRVVLGVTGCIGAYKAALILRLLQKEGFEIVPVMTSAARRFIGPLTLEKLSGNPVISDLFSDRKASIAHIEVARNSDLLLVAPATANILAKFAGGIADDFLSTLYLSTATPVAVAPAMNVEMWRHPAVQGNLQILRRRGVHVIEPGSGYQACGEFGEGRLAEPEKIREAVLRLLSASRSLSGLQVLVTAGPTVEDLDPVRFISNRSTGKMGYALAGEAALRGAGVVLVSGPTSLDPPAGVERIGVRSASEMREAVLERFESVDVVVKVAAVADFTPEAPAPQKIKKNRSKLDLRLTRTPDILAELGRRKTRQFLVGFAAESENVQENARKKLLDKNLDMVVANDVSGTETGFASDSNQVWILDREGGAESFPVLEKAAVARIVWDRIERARAVMPALKVAE